MPSEVEGIINQAQAWRAAGLGVALATVVRTWGSSPRPVGSHLAVSLDGHFTGSVSGGCIEGAVIQEAIAAITDGQPRLLSFEVSDDRAWEVGLACGGRVQVFVERLGPGFDTLIKAYRSQLPVATVTRLADGAQACIQYAGIVGSLDVSPELTARVRQGFSKASSGMLDEAGALFVRVYAALPRLLIVGAVHIAQTLAPMAVMAGFKVVVIDPRRAFANAERFPGIELSDEWPDEALQRLAPDNQTAIVTLTHDPKFDDPTLAAALRSPAFYIGSLGSTRTHAKRVERLIRLGLADQIPRILAPVGLDLGGRQPSEISVSILAQIIQRRYKGIEA